MIDDSLIKFLNFIYEYFTLLFICLLQFTQFFHNIFCMFLHVCEDLLGHLVTAINVFHPSFNHVVFIVDLILQYLPLSFKIGNLDVNLFEYVQFTICLEHSIAKILNLVSTLLLVNLCLVTEVGIFDQSIDNWVDKITQKSTHLRLNIKP